MVDVRINQIAFQLNNATGNQTITDPNGHGQTPKAAIFVVGGNTANDTLTAVARASLGMTDGTSQFATGWMAEDNQTVNIDNGRRLDNATVIQITATTGQTLDYEGAFVSFAAGQVTISNSAARQYRGYVVLFYGADLSANVQEKLSHATAGSSVSITGLSFAPDAVFALCGNSGFAADTGLNGVSDSFGFAGRLPSSTQTCLGWGVVDRSSPIACGLHVRSDSLVQVLNTAASPIVNGVRLTLSAWNSDGIDITTQDLNVAVNAVYLCLRVGGMKCKALTPALAATTSGQSSNTDVGFRARALFALGHRSTTTDVLNSSFSGHSIGCATVPGQTASAVGWNNNDNVSPSESDGISSSTSWVRVPSGAAAHDWIATMVSLDPLGFTYDVTDLGSSNYGTPVFAVGESFESAVPAFVVHRQANIHRARM